MPSEKREGRKPVRRARARRAAPPLPPSPPSAAEQPMDIHKPKAVHNWRELATEIAVIVVGILIAISLEQTVETWHTNERTETAQHAVDTEIRFNLAKAGRES